MAKRFSINRPHLQLADELRRRIREGEISGKLPGLRKLMADFAVTRTTVEGAVAELIQTGDLRDRGPRSAPEAVSRAIGPRETGVLVVFDTPLYLRGGEHREVILGLQATLPGPVSLLSIPGHGVAVDKLVARILETNHSRIVLLDHRAEVADLLVEAGRVVATLGTAGLPVRADYAAANHAALVRGALRHAFAEGHRRVSFPLWRRKPVVEKMMLGWIAEEYSRAGLKHSVGFDSPVVEGDSVAGLHECLRGLLRHTPPTAFIAADFPQWLATVTVLAESGLRVPRDVSVICLCANDECDAAVPAPTHFRYPVAELVRTVKTALEDSAPGRMPTRTLLAPIWVRGGSLGPPPK